MSHESKIFERQPVEIQNLNGFDLSHINTGTAICGKLTPVLRKLLMPGSKFSLGCALNVELPPLATNFFGRVDAVVEVFVCPCAILYGGWRQFISNQVATMFPASQAQVESDGGYALPLISLWPVGGGAGPVFNAYDTLDKINRGLGDYLGVRIDPNSIFDVESPLLNMMPFLAYHLIWNTFYRNASVTKTIFAVNPEVYYSTPAAVASGGGQISLYQKNVSLVWHSFFAEKEYGYVSTATNYRTASNVFDTLASLTFPDGVSIFEMRQRNWSRGYFTAGSVNPQMGNPSAVGFSVDLNTGDGEITIAALRAANSLQKWLEAMNYDPTYRGIMRNHFGVSPSDALLDEPSYVGRVVIPIYQKSVYQQNDQSGSGSSSNPFAGSGDLASKGASGSFNGEGDICHRYKVGCFAYLMGIFSLVPHAMYPNGIDREMLAKDIQDFPFPELQGVGMDGIKLYEIFALYDQAGGNPSMEDDFCYIPRYSRYKYIEDTIHGEIRWGRTLQSFALQRVFNGVPQFSTAFLEIPETQLDQVFATGVNVSNFSCWYEIYWVFKLVQPLAAFCVPTLGDIKDTHTQYTTQGGSRLA